MRVIKISLIIVLSLMLNALPGFAVDEPVTSGEPMAEHIYLTSDKNAVEGATLTVNADYLNGASEASCTYKWYSAAEQEIKSTDGSKAVLLSEGSDKTYTLTENEVNKYIFCVVIPDGGKANISLSYGKIVANTGVNAPAADVSSMRIWANDTSIGSTLYAHYTYQNTNGEKETNCSISWKRSDTFRSGYSDIPNAEGATYTIQPEDYGKFITFTVTPDGGSTADMSSRIYCMPENQLAYAFADCNNKRNALYNDGIMAATDFIVDNRGCQTWGGDGDIIYSFDAGKTILFDKLVFLAAEMNCLDKIEISDDGVNYTDLEIEAFPFTKETVTEYTLASPVSARYIKAYINHFSNSTLSEFQAYLSPEAFSEILGTKTQEIKYDRAGKSITNIPENMTVGALKESLYTSTVPPTIEIKDYDGSVLSDDQKILSGYTLTSCASNGKTTAEYVLSNTDELPKVVVSSIAIEPERIRVGGNAVGKYTLKSFQNEQNAVNASCKWYFSETKDGEYSLIEGADALEYAVPEEKEGGYLRLEILPDGGTARMSEPAGPIHPKISDTPTAPVCDSVTIEKVSDIVYPGDELKGKYTYFDANDDDEDEEKTDKQWFKKEKTGVYIKIEGANGDTYKLKDEDSDCNIVYGVKPYAKEEPQPEDYTYSTPVYVTKEPALADYEVLSIGSNLNNVKSNLILPLKGKNNSDIAWKSDNEGVIGADGVVKQQTSRQNVVLTATIKHPGRELVLTKTFEVIVPAREILIGGGGGGGSSNKNTVGIIVSDSVNRTNPDVNTSIQPVDSYELSDLSADDWSYKYVTDLMEKGILSKPQDGIFRPMDSLKREEAVKMLIEFFGIKNTAARTSFSDISDTDWAYVYIASAAETGIVDGIGDNKFGTGSAVSRQDFAVMTYNALKKTGKLRDTDYTGFSFNDSDSIADYALEAVEYFKAYNIISGTPENTFLPHDDITRKEAAKIISCLSESIEIK